MFIQKLIAGRWMDVKGDVEELDVRNDRYRIFFMDNFYEIYDKDPWTESFVPQPIKFINKTLFPFQD